MKILILTQWFSPEPVYIPTTLARQLAKMGHQVQVLTGFPNYPSGKLEKGYRLSLYKIEGYDGVRVVRVPLYPSHDYSSLKRIANYVSFSFAAATIGVFLANKPDVVFVYYPPSTLFLPAFIMKYLWKVPVVFNIQDIWPEGIIATGMLKDGKGAKAIELMEKASRRIADHIITISPGFKDVLTESGISPEKISVIYNWCDDSAIFSGEKRDDDIALELGISEKFIVMYAGNMGRAQALDAVLDAAALLEKSHPNIHFVFIGGGVDSKRLTQKADEMGLVNTLFLKRMSATKVANFLNVADVLIVHLRDEPLFRITIPSKTQAYMASGKPILMAVRGDAASLVENAEAGISCNPEDPDSIVAAVEVFLTMSIDKLGTMGMKGRSFYKEKLAINIASKKIVDIFNELISSER